MDGWKFLVDEELRSWSIAAFKGNQLLLVNENLLTSGNTVGSTTADYRTTPRIWGSSIQSTL